MGTKTIQIPQEEHNYQGTQKSVQEIEEDLREFVKTTIDQHIPEPKHHPAQGHDAYHACIVLPTYNEARNIKPTLDSIFHQQRLHKDTHVRISVLVVDDNSPDGTAKLVRLYRKKNTHAHLLLRKEKNGLGAAYVAGIQHAIQTLKPDVILEMDADGQHNPADIYRLIQEVKNGADFVIGSRYVPGGSVPKAWKFHRKLLSRAANQYTKAILNTGGAKDCTGGFRAIRTSILQKIDFTQLHIKGYAFQVTLLDACVRHGAIVKEIPIHFLERLQGESKMRPRDMITGGLMLANMRLQRLVTPLKLHQQSTASTASGFNAKRVRL